MQFWTLALILLCSFPYKSGKWSKNVFMAYSSWSSSLLERSCHSNCGCRLVLVPASPSCQLPGNTGSPSVSYPADWASSAHTIFHHGFSYSWFQHNGCLFLHWSCIYYLLETTLVTKIYLSCFFLLPMWPTCTETALWNTIIFWNKQLFCHSSRTHSFFGYIMRNKTAI